MYTPAYHAFHDIKKMQKSSSLAACYQVSACHKQDCSHAGRKINAGRERFCSQSISNQPGDDLAGDQCRDGDGRSDPLVPQDAGKHEKRSEQARQYMPRLEG